VIRVGTRVTVIGLGRMGSGMATALLDAGFAVTVHNRTAERAEPLRAAGAAVAASAGAAVEGADVVLVSLADEAAVDGVLTDRLLDRLAPEASIVDTSTVSPGFARATAARLAARGVTRVEACVIGNPEMARQGRLRVLVAGSPPQAAVAEVLAACAQDVRHVGEAGQASTLKLAFNLLLGVQTAGLAEAVGLVEAAGMARGLLLDALENSGWRSPVLSFRAGYMQTGRYRPAAFSAELMHKDLTLALREARACGAGLPVVARAADRYAEALAAGRGADDAAVLAELTCPPDPGLSTSE
jgi:3-hydroxyisobutyrate dehydrogenase-like beta-hydroxyacid dehydrogenase